MRRWMMCGYTEEVDDGGYIVRRWMMEGTL